MGDLNNLLLLIGKPYRELQQKIRVKWNYRSNGFNKHLFYLSSAEDTIFSAACGPLSKVDYILKNKARYKNTSHLEGASNII